MIVAVRPQRVFAAKLQDAAVAGLSDQRFCLIIAEGKQAFVVTVGCKGNLSAHFAPRTQQFKRGVGRWQIAARHAAGVHLQNGSGEETPFQRLQGDFAVGGIVFIKQTDHARIFANQIKMPDDIGMDTADKITFHLIIGFGKGESIAGIPAVAVSAQDFGSSIHCNVAAVALEGQIMRGAQQIICVGFGSLHRGFICQCIQFQSNPQTGKAGFFLQ